MSPTATLISALLAVPHAHITIVVKARSSTATALVGLGEIVTQGHTKSGSQL